MATYQLPPPPDAKDPLIQGWLFELYKRNTNIAELGTSIDSLGDVIITGTPANNEVLAWDGGVAQWINQTAVEAGLISTAGGQTIAGTLSVSGAFTSLGINDDATLEVLKITDGGIVLGDGTLNGTIIQSIDTVNTIITGGNTEASGGRIILNGSSHADGADSQFFAGPHLWMRFDDSVGDLEILTGTVGSKTPALTINAAQTATFTGLISAEKGINVAGTTSGTINLTGTSGHAIINLFASGTNDGFIDFFSGAALKARISALDTSVLNFYTGATPSLALTIDSSQNIAMAGEAFVITNAGNPRIDITDSGSSSTLRLAAEGASVVVGAESNHPLVLQTNALTALTVNADQSVDITNHIGFPATQVPSAGANDLDDYREGTWTVEMYDALTGGNKSATTITGNYTRVGNIVCARFNSFNNIDTTGMSAGNFIYITLPFAAAFDCIGVLMQTGLTMTANYTMLSPLVSSTRDRFHIRESGPALSDLGMSISSITSTTDDIDDFCMVYIAE